MLNIAVCDDENTALEELSGRISGYLRKNSVSGSISLFRSGDALLKGFENFDAVFLDINMDGSNGLETARLMRESSYGGFLIFVTVLGECVFDSFEAMPYDYLVKPVSDARLERTLCRLLRSLNGRTKDELMISLGSERRIVPLGEIIYCEVLDKTVCLHLSDGTSVSFRGSLEKLEKELDGRFFKCHRSYLVNLEMAEGFGGGFVRLRGGASVPLSKLRKKDFIRVMADYMKNYGR